MAQGMKTQMLRSQALIKDNQRPGFAKERNSIPLNITMNPLCGSRL